MNDGLMVECLNVRCNRTLHVIGSHVAICDDCRTIIGPDISDSIILAMNKHKGPLDALQPSKHHNDNELNLQRIRNESLTESWAEIVSDFMLLIRGPAL